MATLRKLIFAPGQIYHVFNRSVERRPIFTSKREYFRMKELVSYYRFTDTPIRYSQFCSLPAERQEHIWQKLLTSGSYQVAIISYVFMPNHFHFLIKQLQNQGVSRFISNLTNSYAKYFNTKHRRVGSLWQRPFKAVWVETDEQLLHLTRYIHLNPVASFLIQEDELDSYPWSSLLEYLDTQAEAICDLSIVHSFFPKVVDYRSFIHDQIGYARELEEIKHLMLDEKG